jgi:pyridoxine 5'-phosphate synthase PdxJ
MNLKKSAIYAKQLGLEVHAGHGLTYKSAHHVAKLKVFPN